MKTRLWLRQNRGIGGVGWHWVSTALEEWSGMWAKRCVSGCLCRKGEHLSVDEIGGRLILAS